MNSLSLFLCLVIFSFLSVLVAIALIWFCYFRSARRHSHHHNHHNSLLYSDHHPKSLQQLTTNPTESHSNFQITPILTTTTNSVTSKNLEPDSEIEADLMSKKNSSFTSYLIDSDLEPLVQSESKQFQAKSNPINRPIPWDVFSGYCGDNHRDTNYGFSEEFQDLEQISKETLYNSIPRAQNRLFKNRYANIVPYSHSMVKLKKIEEERFSDYINANFIPGVNGQHEYIACQGPLSSTVTDFYRMLLQYRVRIIVSLCRIGPERECSRYFPNQGEPDIEEQINGVNTRVRLVESRVQPDLTINRVQFVRDQDQGVMHQLCQFHYTAWKDFGTPDSIKSLLDMVQNVRHHCLELGPDADARAPIVVHCSAGVGRTGTYIAIDQLWQNISRQFRTVGSGSGSGTAGSGSGTIGSGTESKITATSSSSSSSMASLSPSSSPKHSHNGPKSNLSPILGYCLGARNKQKNRREKKNSTTVPSVDIFGLVYSMRKYRTSMVQTEDQYVFLYDCVNYILSNRVDIGIKPSIESNQQASPLSQSTNEQPHEGPESNNEVDLSGSSDQFHTDQQPKSTHL